MYRTVAKDCRSSAGIRTLPVCSFEIPSCLLTVFLMPQVFSAVMSTMLKTDVTTKAKAQVQCLTNTSNFYFKKDAKGLDKSED